MVNVLTKENMGFVVIYALSWKITKNFMVLSSLFKFALQNKKQSSTNIRWFTAIGFLQILTPLVSLESKRFVKDLDKNSMDQMNKMGDKGSPCLTPLWGMMCPKGPPLRLKVKEEQTTQALIKRHQFLEKPHENQEIPF